MKKIILFSMVFLAGLTLASAQKTDLKKERKAVRQLEREQKLEEIRSIVDSRSFSIESTRVADRFGRQVFVNPTTNFVYLDSSETVIQLAFPHRAGFNGLGGITLVGRSINFEVFQPEQKNKPVKFKMTAFGTALGTIDLWIDINSEAFGYHPFFQSKRASIYHVWISSPA